MIGDRRARRSACQEVRVPRGPLCPVRHSNVTALSLHEERSSAKFENTSLSAGVLQGVPFGTLPGLRCASDCKHMK